MPSGYHKTMLRKSAAASQQQSPKSRRTRSPSRAGRPLAPSHRRCTAPARNHGAGHLSTVVRGVNADAGPYPSKQVPRVSPKMLAVPVPTNETLRTLLNVLKRRPTGAIRDVGVLLMLHASSIEVAQMCGSNAAAEEISSARTPFDSSEIKIDRTAVGGGRAQYRAKNKQVPNRVGRTTEAAEAVLQIALQAERRADGIKEGANTKRKTRFKHELRQPEKVEDRLQSWAATYGREVSRLRRILGRVNAEKSTTVPQSVHTELVQAHAERIVASKVKKASPEADEVLAFISNAIGGVAKEPAYSTNKHPVALEEAKESPGDQDEEGQVSESASSPGGPPPGHSVSPVVAFTGGGRFDSPNLSAYATPSSEAPSTNGEDTIAAAIALPPAAAAVALPPTTATMEKEEQGSTRPLVPPFKRDPMSEIPLIPEDWQENLWDDDEALSGYLRLLDTSVGDASEAVARLDSIISFWGEATIKIFCGDREAMMTLGKAVTDASAKMGEAKKSILKAASLWYGQPDELPTGTTPVDATSWSPKAGFQPFEFPASSSAPSAGGEVLAGTARSRAAHGGGDSSGGPSRQDRPGAGQHTDAIHSTGLVAEASKEDYVEEFERGAFAEETGEGGRSTAPRSSGDRYRRPDTPKIERLTQRPGKGGCNDGGRLESNHKAAVAAKAVRRDVTEGGVGGRAESVQGVPSSAAATTATTIPAGTAETLPDWKNQHHPLRRKMEYGGEYK